MEEAFDGSDAEGFWSWKDAYEACEAAQVLFLKKYGRACQERAASPAALLSMISRIAGLLPTHTRRSEESQNLQQFSTPAPLALRSEEHTSELQSLMRISYAVFSLKKKKHT